MAGDKKISELPFIDAFDATDVSVLIRGDGDYQYSFATLLEFIETGVTSPIAITFGTVVPQNTVGKNGDVFINTATSSFAQKVAGSWTVQYTLPASIQNSGAVLYGLGAPSSGTGGDGDTYLNTGSGVFYLKSEGSWLQMFSMQTGPQGATGPKGETGPSGTNGNTVLNGAANPLNNIGIDGDFYINTSNLHIYGPKRSGVWGAGISLSQSISTERYFQSTANPTLTNWQTIDAAIYGNYPRLRLLVEDSEGNEIEAQSTYPKYTVDRTDPANPRVTQIAFELAEPLNCTILIN